MVKKPYPRRAAAAAAVLFCAVFLSTCDFLTSDIFPSWLSYAEASVNLRAIMKAQGLGDLAVVESVEYADWKQGSIDYSKVLVFTVGNGTNKLILLDPRDLQFVHADSNSEFSRSLASTSIGFLSGKRIISPIDFSLTAAPNWSTPYSVRVFRVGIDPTGTNFAVDLNSSQQGRFEEYPNAWGAFTSSVTRDFDALAGMYAFLDAEYVNGYSVLGRRESGPYMGFASSFSSAADFTSIGTVFDKTTVPVPEKTGPFRMDENGAWLTAGGPVAFVRGDRDSDRLVRYRWGTGGFSVAFGDYGNGYWTSEEADSIPIENNDEFRILSFDPSGTWWFGYDRRTGMLYKLRTWWK